MTPKMNTKILHKSTWGALWATWDPYRPKKEVQIPLGEPKRMSKAPLWHHSYNSWILFSMFFNKFHYRISTMPNYLRINKHYALMPTLATPATTQTATNKKGAGGRGEAFRSAAPACGEPGRDAKHPFKICQTLSENLSLQQPRPFRRADPNSIPF